MIIREFNLPLNAGVGTALVINVNQYDSGENWYFTLYEENGMKYTPTTASIIGVKPDGNAIANSATVDGNGRVVVEETEQMTACAGRAEFELTVDSTHGTANFILMVEKKPTDESIPSDSDLSLIQEALDSTNPQAIAQGVSDWMDDNLTPTTPVVDASLTVSGAAADAKKTGDEISELKSALRETKEVTGTLIAVNDAIDGEAPVTLPQGGLIYSRNMYQANIATRTSSDVDFTIDANDPNKVTISGTATSNAYSFGSINSSNAGALLEAGTYFIARYLSTGERGRVSPIRLYIDVINYSTDVKVSTSEVLDVYRLTLTEKSYVGVRVQVPSGETVNNVTCGVYISKLPPYKEYVPYIAPQTSVMHEHSVVEFDLESTLYYAAKLNDESPKAVKVATFNVGGYNHGNSVETIPPDFADYTKAISQIGADILCTQEDRIIYDSSNEITTKDKLYKYMYKFGEIASYSSSSTTGAFGKGVYTSVCNPLYERYTFDAQGVTTEGGSTQTWSSAALAYCWINNKSILVISVHLAPKSWNTAVRKSQIQELLNIVNDINADETIICGDFNSWEDEMEAFDQSAWTLANQGQFGEFVTFYTGNHPFDNIVVSNGIKMQKIEVVTNNLNDHYALVSDLVF